MKVNTSETSCNWTLKVNAYTFNVQFICVPWQHMNASAKRTQQAYLVVLEAEVDGSDLERAARIEDSLILQHIQQLILSIKVLVFVVVVVVVVVVDCLPWSRRVQPNW